MTSLRFLLALALTAALGACSGDERASAVDLTILHFNDLHARLLPDDQGRGGYAHLASVLADERATAPAHLTLHAGDLVQGTPVSTLFKGLPAVELANGLGIDAHCLGNHEFDYGWERVGDFIGAAQFDTISANVLNSEGRTLAQPWVLHEAGGLRIAIVGAMTEHLLGLVTSKQLGPWRAAPLIDTLRPVVAEAAAASDLVIVLGHLSRRETESILQSLPEVSIVIKGHGHRGWQEPIEIDGRLAVEASGYGRTIGRLSLAYQPRSRRIESWDWELLPVIAAEVAPNPELAAEVEMWEGRVSDVVDIPIGRADRELRGREIRELIEDAMLASVDGELAYMNNGGVRDVLPRGELLARQVWNVMPFDNTLVTLNLTGAEMLRLPELSGGEIDIDAESVDPIRRYLVVTSDYSALSWQDSGLAAEFSDTGLLIRDLIIDHIKARRVLD